MCIVGSLDWGWRTMKNDCAYAVCVQTLVLHTEKDAASKRGESPFLPQSLWIGFAREWAVKMHWGRRLYVVSCVCCTEEFLVSMQNMPPANLVWALRAEHEVETLGMGKTEYSAYAQTHRFFCLLLPSISGLQVAFNSRHCHYVTQFSHICHTRNLTAWCCCHLMVGGMVTTTLLRVLLRYTCMCQFVQI